MTDPQKHRLRLCFVCLGNICRSPTAEGIMQHLVNEAGLAQSIAIDSAGTSAYHAGESADERSRQTAAEHDVIIDQVSRQFHPHDLDRFDLILAMDQSNLDNLLRLATNDEQRKKIHRLREFDPHAKGELDVPDPYYGGSNGFEKVFQMCFRSCEVLLEKIREDYDL
ncbi:MAG: low molecular weight phosphotyrosine protein phosphatase [Myxococcales bacterium]|nr:MAG: low molecular weight phosphotyrosine protein phosphatase [Myxococcales bacterium]